MFSLNGHVFYEPYERCPGAEVPRGKKYPAETEPAAMPEGCCGKFRRTGVCCEKYLRRKNKKTGEG
jgi:hypothetical protein